MALNACMKSAMYMLATFDDTNHRLTFAPGSGSIVFTLITFTTGPRALLTDRYTKYVRYGF